MKRMQVQFPDEEFAELQAVARSQGQTLAEWVRQALRAAVRRRGAGDRQRKLQAVREAAACEFPTADIDVMIAEIQSGYGSGSDR